MSSDPTRFQLSLHGIKLELEGDREFVDAMYRDIMRDIEEARRRMLSGKPSGLERSVTRALAPKSAPAQGILRRPKKHSVGGEVATAGRDGHVVWIHRCAQLVHKIYMAAPRDLAQLPLMHHVNVSQIATAYIEDKLLSELMPRFDKGQTLWAELTRDGRRQIAEASLKPPHTVPSPPQARDEAAAEQEEATTRLLRPDLSAQGIKGTSST